MIDPFNGPKVRWASFLAGMASALDLGGTLYQRPESCADLMPPAQADMLALLSDSYAIGYDARRAQASLWSSAQQQKR
jgi:hypothetical protein